MNSPVWCGEQLLHISRLVIPAVLAVLVPFLLVLFVACIGCGGFLVQAEIVLGYTNSSYMICTTHLLIF